jgi:hypothetical protein
LEQFWHNTELQTALFKSRLSVQMALIFRVPRGFIWGLHSVAYHRHIIHRFPRLSLRIQQLSVSAAARAQITAWSEEIELTPSKSCLKGEWFIWSVISRTRCWILVNFQMSGDVSSEMERVNVEKSPRAFLK